MKWRIKGLLLACGHIRSSHVSSTVQSLPRNSRTLQLFTYTQQALAITSSEPSIMAARATSLWRSMVSRVGGSSSRRFTSTAAPTIDMLLNEPVKPNPRVIRGDFVPVYVAFGMIMLSMSFGLHCAKQQLLYAPNVFVSKKKRETFPEVYDPDYVVDEADKFKTKSFFRRIAHVQEFEKDEVMLNPVSGDALKSEKRAVTLKSVGVEPSKV